VTAGQVVNDVVAFLRVKHYHKKGKDIPNPANTIDANNEDKAVGELIDGIAHAIERYPKLQQLSNDASWRQRTAQYIVSEEISILRKAATAVLALLEFDEEGTEKKLKYTN